MNSGCLYIKRENFIFDENYGIYYTTIPPLPFHLGKYNSVIIDITKPIVIDGNFHVTYYDSDTTTWKEMDDTIAAAPFSTHFKVEDGNIISGKIPGNANYRVQIRIDKLANIIYNEDNNNYGMAIQIEAV